MSAALMLPKTGRFLPVPEPTPPTPGPTASAPSATPKRRIDRVATPGCCVNLDYCSIGLQRRLVRVPVSQAFVCPECGGALRPPVRTGRSGSRLLPLARLGILAGGMAASLVAGYLAGRAQTPVIQAASRVRQVAAGQIGLVRTALLAARPPSPQPAQTGPQPTVSDPFLPSVVEYRPWPARVGPAEVSSPARLLHEARAGPRGLDWTRGGRVTPPVGPQAAARGRGAFSASALAWLRQLRVQYALPRGQTSSALPDHRWRVVFEDYEGQQLHAAF